jgi:hypothetical protein
MRAGADADAGAAVDRMIEPSRGPWTAFRRSWGTRRVAIALWIAWAIVVWNVVFDRVVVVAGRTYLRAAAAAAEAGAPYVRIEDWMRPAAVRGAWLASAAATAILLVGFCLLKWAAGTRRGA